VHPHQTRKEQMKKMIKIDFNEIIQDKNKQKKRATVRE
jgi:hypothetical protein